jgi:hypothetical protein
MWLEQTSMIDKSSLNQMLHVEKTVLKNVKTFASTEYTPTN